MLKSGRVARVDTEF